MTLKFAVADVETFFDSKNGYTLRAQTTEEYCRDKRFEPHGWAVKWHPDIPARWYDDREFRYIVRQEDWSNIFLISHNAIFDHFILNHTYDVRPRVSGCTMSMGRMLIPHHLSVSLDNMRKLHGLPEKRTPYNLFDGRHWSDMDVATREKIADGATDEVESIWWLFKKMMNAGFPREELEVIDLTIKMFSQPELRGDIDMLGRLWESEDKRRYGTLAELGVTETQLQSADKFKALLEAEGIEIEYKNGKNDLIPAFAKNDEFMLELLEHPDDRVRSLAEARLGVKSTILQTRAETFGFMATRGAMPVALRYCGAMTLRFSGSESSNWQNLKRKDEDSPKEASPLRRAIMAPEGYLLAPIDLAQIERRVECYVAGQEDALEEFRRGDDPYVAMASDAYGYPVTKDMKLERGTGKQLTLSCGYMAAEKSIQKTARLGIYGPPVEIDLNTAIRWKNAYRTRNYKIVEYWKTAGRMIACLAGGEPTDWGVLHIRDHKIFLPNGTFMNYDSLEYHVPDEEEKKKLKEFEWKGFWRMKTRQGWKTVHAGKITQNICEAISRVIVTQAAIRIHRAGFRILNVPHDELLVLIPRDGREVEATEWCRQQMMITPDWLPGIPLDAEASLGERYEK